jgi:hypothetical protein
LQLAHGFVVWQMHIQDREPFIQRRVINAMNVGNHGQLHAEVCGIF